MRTTKLMMSAAMFTVVAAPLAHAEEGMTLAALQVAYQREVRAEQCYRAYEARAVQEGYSMAATLFGALADGEAIQGRGLAIALEKLGVTPVPATDPPVVGTTDENLAAALVVELLERRVHQRFMAYARSECLYDALAAMRYARDGEIAHARCLASVIMDPWRLDFAYYLCPGCGVVRTSVAAGTCACGASGRQLVAVKRVEVAAPAEPTLARR